MKKIINILMTVLAVFMAVSCSSEATRSDLVNLTLSAAQSKAIDVDTPKANVYQIKVSPGSWTGNNYSEKFEFDRWIVLDPEINFTYGVDLGKFSQGDWTISIRGIVGPEVVENNGHWYLGSDDPDMVYSYMEITDEYTVVSEGSTSISLTVKNSVASISLEVTEGTGFINWSEVTIPFGVIDNLPGEAYIKIDVPCFDENGDPGEWQLLTWKEYMRMRGLTEEEYMTLSAEESSEMKKEWMRYNTCELPAGKHELRMYIETLPDEYGERSILAEYYLPVTIYAGQTTYIKGEFYPTSLVKPGMTVTGIPQDYIITYTEPQPNFTYVPTSGYYLNLNYTNGDYVSLCDYNGTPKKDFIVTFCWNGTPVSNHETCVGISGKYAEGYNTYTFIIQDGNIVQSVSKTVLITDGNVIGTF